MDRIAPPEYLGLPSAPIVLLILLLVTFVLHLFVMNMMLGGALLGFIFHALGGKREPFRDLSARMRSWLAVTISLTITTGVAPLLFVQVLYGQFFYTANVIMGWYWLGIVGLLLIAFLSANGDPKKQTPTMSFGIALLVAAVGVLMVYNAIIVIRPEQWIGLWTSHRVRPVDDMLYPRILHFAVGSIVVAAIALVFVADFFPSLFRDEAMRSHAAAVGARVALPMVLIQGGIGLWFWYSLEEPVHKSLMSFDSLMSSLWLIAVAAVLLSILLLIGLAARSASRPLAGLCMGLAVVALAGMAWGREFVRLGYLAEEFSADKFTVNWQVGPLVMFLASFAVGIGVLAYLGKVVREAAGSGSGAGAEDSAA